MSNSYQPAYMGVPMDDMNEHPPLLQETSRRAKNGSKEEDSYRGLRVAFAVLGCVVSVALLLAIMSDCPERRAKANPSLRNGGGDSATAPWPNVEEMWRPAAPVEGHEPGAAEGMPKKKKPCGTKNPPAQQAGDTVITTAAAENQPLDAVAETEEMNNGMKKKPCHNKKSDAAEKPVPPVEKEDAVVVAAAVEPAVAVEERVSELAPEAGTTTTTTTTAVKVPCNKKQKLDIVGPLPGPPMDQIAFGETNKIEVQSMDEGDVEMPVDPLPPPPAIVASETKGKETKITKNEDVQEDSEDSEDDLEDSEDDEEEDYLPVREFGKKDFEVVEGATAVLEEVEVVDEALLDGPVSKNDQMNQVAVSSKEGYGEESEDDDEDESPDEYMDVELEDGESEDESQDESYDESMEDQDSEEDEDERESQDESKVLEIESEQVAFPAVKELLSDP